MTAGDAIGGRPSFPPPTTGGNRKYGEAAVAAPGAVDRTNRHKALARATLERAYSSLGAALRAGGNWWLLTYDYPPYRLVEDRLRRWRHAVYVIDIR